MTQLFWTYMPAGHCAWDLRRYHFLQPHQRKSNPMDELAVLNIDMSSRLSPERICYCHNTGSC